MRFDTVADHYAGIGFLRKTGRFGPFVTSVTTVVSVANDARGRLIAALSFRTSRFGNSTRTFPTIGVSGVEPTYQVAPRRSNKLHGSSSGSFGAYDLPPDETNPGDCAGFTECATICTAPPANIPCAGLKPPSVCHVRHERNCRVVSNVPIVLCANSPSRRLLSVYVTVCHGMSPSVTDRLRSCSRVVNGLPSEYVIRQTERGSHAKPQRRSLSG
jgi:hypothetical protein